MRERIVALHPVEFDGVEDDGNNEGLDFFQGDRGSMEEFKQCMAERQDRDNPERACRWGQFLEALSCEAREIVELMVNVPDELLEFVVGKGTHQSITKNSLRQYLRFRGWKFRIIEQVFLELAAKVKKVL